MHSSYLERASRPLLLILSMFAAAAPPKATAQTWTKGDVFVGNIQVGGGFYDVYSNNGVYKGLISDGSPYGGTWGCAFNKDHSKLYTTDSYYDEVHVFDATGTTHPLLKSFSVFFAGYGDESIVFNQVGDYYVGNNSLDIVGAPPVGVAEYSDSDNLLTTYRPPYSSSNNAVIGMDLSLDQKTLFYTSGANTVKRYDLVTGQALADFGTVGPEAAGIRLLPPYDGSGGLLIADGTTLLRLDQFGHTVQTYTANTGYPYFGWTDVALDPNGKSFWATEQLSSTFFRFNIASGAVELNAGHPLQGGLVSGICVLGVTEGPDVTPPTVKLSESLSGPPKKVLLESYDEQSGLASVVVDSCTNCTAATDAFAAGSNNIIVTTATKTDQTKSSSIEITATDVAGNKTTFDPVDLTLESEGYPTIHTIRILPSENILVITNGAPGLSEIELTVNGQALPEITLRDRESRTIDLAQFMHKKEKSDIRIKAEGKDRSTAWLVFTEP